MQIELQFSLTPEDYMEFQRATVKRVKRMARRSMSRSMVGWVVIMAVAVFFFVVFHKDRAPATPAPAPAPSQNLLGAIVLNFLPYFAVFVFIWIFFLSQLRPAKRIRQQFKDSPELGEARRAVASAENFTMYRSTSTTIMAWSHFPFFTETANLFLLYENQAQAYIVPKRAFTSPVDAGEFRAFVQAHVGNQPGGFPVLPAAKDSGR